MTDDEFNGLVIRYLEDALDEKEQRLLNRELLDSPERVHQFNDFRMLAGMILEQGRGEANLATFPGMKQNRTGWSRWLAVAAVLAIGLFAGILIDGKRSGEVEGSRISFDFEQPDPGAFVEGFPKAPGHWSGDRIEMVSKKDAKVSPCVGDWAACLTLPKQATPPPTLSNPKPASQWRIVALPKTAPKKEANVAELCVQFNRDAEVPDPDLPCRIELYAFRGPPETAESRLGSEDYLAAAITHFRPDSDPKTWEKAKAKLQVAPDTEFLLLGISGFGERTRQSSGQEKFTGHYADGVELRLFKSNNQLEKNK